MSPALLLLADGRFPAGGHAHSAGVEAAVRYGDVHDEATLARYLHARLASTGVTDAAFATAAVASPDRVALDVELTVRILSPRLREVGRRMGRQLLRAGRRVWPDTSLDALDGCQQPIVLGALVAAAGGAAHDAATIAMHHLSAAVTSAGVRLLGLDPIGVAAVQAAAVPLIADLVASADDWAAAAPCDLPALGGALTDILGEDHGRWTARLFVA
jgi:urease accessory protein